MTGDEAGREAAVRSAFREQVGNCAALGSPFTARLCALFAERLDHGHAAGNFILSWPGDPSAFRDNVPLRLCGAINYMVMSGRAPDLAGWYPPRPGHDELTDDRLWSLLDRFLGREGEAVIAFLALPPQTNEVRRSAALIPAWHALARRFNLPLAIRELGASAGLNLNADRYLLDGGTWQLGEAESPLVLQPQWKGDEPHEGKLVIASAAGCDLSAVDVSEDEKSGRLLAYVWPDQPERVQLIRAAIGLARVNPPRLENRDAAIWLEEVLEAHLASAASEILVIQHTIAWQYFPLSVRQRCETLLEQAGAITPAERPVARLSMEADGRNPGACLSLTIWPGANAPASTLDLGRADFHGRWVDWKNPVWT